ncbi:MAG: hypothetical protein JNM27_16160 [Leptospirales bacterium]|nr:hypothetical protein [Leptospirales bacterium]
MKRALALLSVDSIGGLLVGCLVMLLAPWLSDVYGWPIERVRIVGLANLSYGTYSGTLVLILWRNGGLRPWSVRLLVGANLAWGLGCFLQLLFWLPESTTVAGISILVLEGIYVAILGWLEAKYVLPVLS